MVSNGRGLEVIRYMVFGRKEKQITGKMCRDQEKRTGQSCLCSASLL